jgi:hypothetical protein
MFGTRWLATLYGFAFLSHQVGGFLGVLSALINLPIVEAPVACPVAQLA